LIDGTPDCSVRSLEDEEDDDVLPSADAGWIVSVSIRRYPISNTLYVEADEPRPDRRYAVIVTRGVKGANTYPCARESIQEAIGDDDEDFSCNRPSSCCLSGRLCVQRSEVRFFGAPARHRRRQRVYDDERVVIEKIWRIRSCGTGAGAGRTSLSPNGERAFSPARLPA
jgi:hypothetical protein